MTHRASPQTTRWSSVALSAVFLAALAAASTMLVSRGADLAPVLLLGVSAAGLVASWQLRAAHLELRRLALRTAELQASRSARSELLAEAPAPGAAPGEVPAAGEQGLPEPAAAGPAGPPPPADPQEPELRILVAEDNPVNQEVALLMLHRLGYRADVAGNGLEVLEALTRQTYDVILMDVQMPAMDGLEATRRVRRRFRGERRPRIIAITAHADRAQCLAAGMDDYLTKPIHKEALATALCVAADPESGHTIGGPSETESIDKDRLALLRNLRTKAQQSLLAQIIDLFFESSAEDLSVLRDAVERDDRPAMREAAHSLLGSSSDLGLTAVSDICLEIKQMSPDSPREQLTSTVERMEHHLRRARRALERVRALS